MNNTKQKLTEEQKKSYLANSGACPVCKSRDIEGDSHDYEGDQVWMTVRCLNPGCGKEWRDVYTLALIEDVD